MTHSKTKRKLSAYWDEELEPHLLHEIKTHLTSCPSCRSEVAHLQQTYAFLETEPALENDPFMTTRVKAIISANSSNLWRPIWAFVQKGLVPTIIAAGLLIGIQLGVKLNGALQINQQPMSDQRVAPLEIDENMFTTMPGGSLTSSYITLTSATE